MTDTGNAAAGGNADLSALKIPELRKMAAEKGLKGVSGLRKGDLIQAIVTGEVPRKARAAAAEAAAEEHTNEGHHRRASRRSAGPADGEHAAQDAQAEQPQQGEQAESEGQKYESRSAARRARRNRARQDQDDNNNRDDKRDEKRDNNDHDNNNDNNGRGGKHNNRGGRNNSNNNDDGNQGGGGRRGRRNRRNRNRNRDNRDNQHNQNDNNQQFDPEELQEVAGIVDIVDNNAAFVRTTGYRKNSADVYVNQKLVRQNGLRAGDAVIGQVRQNGQSHSHGNGRNRQRYNQLVRVDSVNGMTTEEAKQRAEFHKLTPLYPNKRLRLETEPKILTTRVIDLVMPIVKGHRALIVSRRRLVRRRSCRTSPTRSPLTTRSATSWSFSSTSARKRSRTCSAA